MTKTLKLHRKETLKIERRVSKSALIKALGYERGRTMSIESLDHVVAGALFDFAGFLTTRKERILCSAKDNAVPVADALKEFMELRGVDIDCEPMLDLWPCRMANGKCKPFTE